MSDGKGKAERVQVCNGKIASFLLLCRRNEYANVHECCCCRPPVVVLPSMVAAGSAGETVQSEGVFAADGDGGEERGARASTHDRGRAFTCACE